MNHKLCHLLKLWFLQTSASLWQLNLNFSARFFLMAPWPVKYDTWWNHQEYKASGDILHACMCMGIYCLCVCEHIFMYVHVSVFSSTFLLGLLKLVSDFQLHWIYWKELLKKNAGKIMLRTLTVEITSSHLRI